MSKVSALKKNSLKNGENDLLFKDRSNLIKLEQLTPKLPPPLSSFVSKSHQSHAASVEYEVENGVAFGFNLWNIKKVAIQRAFMSRGAVFPTHQHDEVEILIVYEGKLSVNKEHARECSNVNELQVGQCVRFSSGESHSVTALENTHMIAITIPAAEGYPEDEK